MNAVKRGKVSSFTTKFLFIFLICFSPFNSFGEEEKEKTEDNGKNSEIIKKKNVDLGKVKVVAKDKDARELEKVMNTPSFVDVFNTSESSQKVNSVSDILAERVGVQVKRYGGLGSYSTLPMKGVNASTVTIFLDGIPLNDAKYGEINLEDLPIDNLDRIEVYKGTTPGRFGVSGITGVVNLVTKKSGEHCTHTVAVSYGSYNTLRMNVSRSERIKNFDYLIYANRKSTDGDYEFLDDNGTPLRDLKDDSWTKRKNNKHVAYNLTGKAGYTMGKFRFFIMNDYFRKDQGMPGMYNNSAKYINFETVRNILNLGVEVNSLWGGRWNAKFNMYYATREDHFNNIKGEEIGVRGGTETLAFFDSLGFDFTQDFDLSQYGHSINLLLSFQMELYNRDDKNVFTYYETKSAPQQFRDRYIVVLEDNMNFLDGRFQILPQIRFEFWGQQLQTGDSRFGETKIIMGDASTSNHIGFQGGIKYFPGDAREFYLKGNVFNGFRPPSFSELFGERGYIVGNANLQSEESLNRDIGFGWQIFYKNAWLNMILFEFSYFHNEVYDLIIFMHNSQWTVKAQNIAATDIKGYQFIMGTQFFDHVKLNGNYTFQEAKDDGLIPYYKGKYLPYRPLNEFTFSGKLYTDMMSLTYRMTYIGSNFRDKANSGFYFVRHRHIHNVAFEYYFIKTDNYILKLNGEVKNILQNRISDVVGYPLPGRSYYVSLSGKF